MMNDFHDVDAKLERLAQATNQIQPGPRFHDRVMSSVRLVAVGDWRVGIWRVGRYGLALAALAVVLATAFAMHGASKDDEQQAIAYGTVDVEW